MSYESKFLKSIEDDIVTLKSLKLSYMYHIYLKGYTLWLVDKWTFYHRIVWVDRESNKENGSFHSKQQGATGYPQQLLLSYLFQFFQIKYCVSFKHFLTMEYFRPIGRRRMLSLFFRTLIQIGSFKTSCINIYLASFTLNKGVQAIAWSTFVWVYSYSYSFVPLTQISSILQY